jgi:Protein of unknown function (DUF3047)
MTGRLTTWVASALLFVWAPVVGAQMLQPFSSAASDALPAPWRLVGLPKGKAPLAQIELATLSNERVLKLATDKSYGTLLHELKPVVLGAGSTLKWRWRLEQPIAAADLKVKEGDDAPLKVCAMFDMPLDKLKFLERNLVRLARSISGEKLPAATLCYVWDHKLAVGTELPNAYSPRLRFVVLDSGDKKLGQWTVHERDLAVDLQRAFGHEFATPPPLIAIVVGADSDNTQGSSLAYLGDITLTAKPSE